jgi:hypothetical protein
VEGKPGSSLRYDILTRLLMEILLESSEYRFLNADDSAGSARHQGFFINSPFSTIEVPVGWSSSPIGKGTFSFAKSWPSKALPSH